MGMAASQARYLALVARQSNCEYQGQQINQARTALSNQSANLFNQMLGLNVPVPPSTQDFTKTQYSFSDGVNTVTMDSWKQLANPESDYNYSVTYHYNSDVYTGFQKKLNDPQVQFTSFIPSVDEVDQYNEISKIQKALEAVKTAQADYDKYYADYQTLLSKASKLSTYSDTTSVTDVDRKYYNSVKNTYIVSTKDAPANEPPVDTENYFIYQNDEGKEIYKDPKSGDFYTNETDGDYTVYKKDDEKLYYKDGKFYSDNTGTTEVADHYGFTILRNKYTGSTTDYYQNITGGVEYKGYDTLSGDALTKAAKIIRELEEAGAIEKGYNTAYVYYNEGSNTVAFKNDLIALKGESGTKIILPVYHGDSNAYIEGTSSWYPTEKIVKDIEDARKLMEQASKDLQIANDNYDKMNVPAYVGNCQLKPLSELSSDEFAEIRQILKDMADQNVETTITKCFDSAEGDYSADNYIGGLYSFKLNGVTYYATHYDLANVANSGQGINNIDNQLKLPYYSADYISKKIEATDKALLQTDSTGRFSSIRIGDNTITYELHMETVTDDNAYQDAMNQYYYENAKYDKMIQDINAKTSIIQQEDQQLELKLKQLDTERNALTNEIEAVSKVVKDNVEKSFKAFGG